MFLEQAYHNRLLYAHKAIDLRLFFIMSEKNFSVAETGIEPVSLAYETNELTNFSIP